MTLLATSPLPLVGQWSAGFALALHTLSSHFAGYDEYGNPVYDTERTAVGEALYQLKYHQDASQVGDLGETAAEAVRAWRWPVSVVVPVPSSRTRTVAPVLLVGAALATQLGVPFEAGALTRTRPVPELKNVLDFGERQRLLEDAHAVDASRVKGQAVLLFDDLFRSGATMNAAAQALLAHGASAVFALTLTRTRSSR